MKITNVVKIFSLLMSVVMLILPSVIGATNIKYDITENKSISKPIGILLSEGFEEGTMPPSGGWYTIDNNPIYNWEIVDNATYPDFVHSGDYAGWVNYDSGNQSDEWLISPDIDLTGLDEVTLVFWAESDTNWPGATVELHVRGEGFDDVIWDMIKDESWDDFIYREMTFDLSNYICQIINISWRYVGFDGQSFGLDDILVSSGPLKPNLCCEGSLSWTNITAGATVSGEFQVCNCGDEGSLLNWEIIEVPSWGTWKIEPDNGSGLAAGDCININVSVIAPSEKNSEFEGSIKIINSDRPNDNCEIDVFLSTPKNKALKMHFNLIDRLVDRFPNSLLLLKQLFKF